MLFDSEPQFLQIHIINSELFTDFLIYVTATEINIIADEISVVKLYFTFIVIRFSF